ncbi:MAG TPA: DUF5985 family protein [Rhizomicrobium sp.]|jgi:hypothetical protein|nr:DUF5985 family protein [Rhizomicrobium sp.]
MSQGATAVYVLCLLTSALCAGLLARSYLRSRAALLLWSALCFAMLALNNLLVIIDIVVLPEIDLSAARDFTALLGLGFLLYGFIWEVDR